jgi:hypothetical protein
MNPEMHFSTEAEDMHAAASELAGREELDALDILAEIRAGGRDDDDYEDSELDGREDAYLDASYEDRTDDSHMYPDDCEHDESPEFFGGE